MTEIVLTNPIGQVTLLDEDVPTAHATEGFNADTQKMVAELEAEKLQSAELMKVLSSIVSKLEGIYIDLFSQHKSQIAALAMEIARKVLMVKIQDRDYQIEKIIEQALARSPDGQKIVLKLNPDDLKTLGENLKKDELFQGVDVVADAQLGRAECIVETDKGVVQSLIDSHLAEIGKALEQTN